MSNWMWKKEGGDMDEQTRREIDVIYRRLTRIERRFEVQGKYLELIGTEIGGGAGNYSNGAGHLKKASELINELMVELKKI